jgi:RNA polymerase sigma factor (sigma-70 family)
VTPDLTYAEAKRLVAGALKTYPADPDYEAAAWAGLHHAIERTDGTGSFVAFAQMCMRSSLRNAWRAKRVRATKRPLGGLDDVAACALDEPVERDGALARTLTRAVRRLTPRQAQAVELVLVEGLGYKAAGERMGVASTSVQHSIWLAKCDLKIRLAAVHAETNQ